MLNNGCVLHPEQYNLLFKTSFIALLSCIYSFYNGYYEFSVSSGWIFLTSINYWRKPNYSWRRDLDMISVKFALVHHVIRGYNSEYYKYYCIFTFISIFCYKLSCYFHKKKMYWLSTYSHASLHVFANIANIILYTGQIVPLRRQIYSIMSSHPCDVLGVVCVIVSVKKPS